MFISLLFRLFIFIFSLELYRIYGSENARNPANNHSSCPLASRATLLYFVSLRCFLIIRCSLTICSALSRDISTGPMPGKVAVTVFLFVSIIVFVVIFLLVELFHT